MKVCHLDYRQYENAPEHWSVQLPLLPQTLLIGRNAVGKSRTLAVMNSLARILASRRSLTTGDWRIHFRDGEVRYEYHLLAFERIAFSEELKIDGEVKLTRRPDGTGEIFSDGEMRGFKIPHENLAVLLKRDLQQHQYLEPLHKWASSFRFYDFGSEMGRNTVAVIDPSATDVDLSGSDQVIGVFRKGLKQFGGSFKQSVIDGMAELGYEIEEIGNDPSPNVVPLDPRFIAPVVALYAKERDLPVRTWQQPDMSRGMFRALSALIHMEFLAYDGQASTIVIDDVGEGLDISRGQCLLKYLKRRANDCDAQLILASNYRHVINSFPLDGVCGLRRTGGRVSAISAKTHPEIFNEFRDSGLANTDLITSHLI